MINLFLRSLFMRNKFSVLRCSSFLSGVRSSLGYIIAKLHLNHCKASPCVFNLSFFLSSFHYRSSSWRLYMMVHQGFFSFFNCSSRFLSKLWPAKLYSKINMVFSTCLLLRSSSILHLAFQSAILLPYQLRWCYVALDNFLHGSSFILFSRMRYFKSINLFVGVILGYISPKAFHWECCYLWCLSMIRVFSYPLGERSFHLFFDLKQAIVFR